MQQAAQLSNARAMPRPWKRAAAWLLLLGPFFYLSYGFANWFTAQRSDVDQVVFGWEQHIPFLAWTIFPYWSVNLFYAASLFVCRSTSEVDTHGRRLLAAQIVSVLGFLLFPLQFSFARPQTDGAAGFMFDVLMSFDKPYNQAPSLHISLLVILWFLYARYTVPRWRWVLHTWFVLIGVSILTTYQHHFIDLPTGLWVGLLCVWLFPHQAPSPLRAWRLFAAPRSKRLALYYGLGSVLLGTIALALGAAALWLLWISAALTLTAMNYAGFGTAGFQKGSDGTRTLAAQLLLWPVLLGVRINCWVWTRRLPAAAEVAEGVWLGRFPSRSELQAQQFRAVLDLTAECTLDARGLQYRCLPVLDLTAPSAQQLLEAASAIDELRSAGKTLVCCALGFSRSASAVAACLLHTQRANTVDEALQRIRQARPQIVLRAAELQALQAFHALSCGKAMKAAA